MIKLNDKALKLLGPQDDSTRQNRYSPCIEAMKLKFDQKTLAKGTDTPENTTPAKPITTATEAAAKPE